MANTSKIKEIRDEMIKIYGNNCWMGYRLTKNNPFTFHHIFEQRVGGKDLIENGALLTKFAHRDLNTMDLHAKPLYKELNILFKELNNTKKAPTIDYYKEVNKILVRASKVIKLSSNCILNPDFCMLKDVINGNYSLEITDEFYDKRDNKKIEKDGYIKIDGVYIPYTKEVEVIEVPFEYKDKVKHKSRSNKKYIFK